MSSSLTSSPSKRKSHALEEGKEMTSPARTSPSRTTHTGSPAKQRATAAVTTTKLSSPSHVPSPGQPPSPSHAPSPGQPPSSSHAPSPSHHPSPSPAPASPRPPWSDYSLLQEMTAVAELTDVAVGYMGGLDVAVQEAERACADLAGKREELERDLLDWKNLLVQKVEGCYTQVLDQLLEAFDGPEGEAVLRREFVSNSLWSLRQLCQASRDAVNTPDLDTLRVLKNRLRTKLVQVEAAEEEERAAGRGGDGAAGRSAPGDVVAEWRYNQPEIGDDVIWRLMGSFDLGPNSLDSATPTPTTPCHDTPGFTEAALPGPGGRTAARGRPAGLPIVSVTVSVTGHVDENLNMHADSDGGDSDGSESRPAKPQLLAAFQTRTLLDSARCHPVSLALVPGGHLVVPDKHNQKVKLFTQDGELVREITHAALTAPTHVAVTPDGDIAVCDRKAGDVKVFSARGACLLIVPKLFRSPAGIAFTSAGDLVVGDTGRRAVHVVSLPAAVVKATLRHFRTPVPGSACSEHELSQLHWPHCVTVNADDVIVVSDRSAGAVQMLDLAGHSVGRFGSPGHGKGRLHSPHGTALGQDGSLLVCDYGNHSLQVLTPGGRWGEPLLTSSMGLQFPSAVVWLSASRFAVAEYLSGIIKVFQLPDCGQKHPVKRMAARSLSPVF